VPHRLDVPAFDLGVAGLDQLEFPSGPAGTGVGLDGSGGPVLLRLFRARPTRVTVLGGMYLVRLLVLRAFGFGARVIVQTERSAAWQGWPAWVTGREDRLLFAPAAEAVTAVGTPQSPVLVVQDTGHAPSASAALPGHWQTQLTVLPQLTAYGFGSLVDTDVLMMQRLRRDEALAAGGALRLGPEVTEALQAVPDDMIALRGRGTHVYVWLDPSPVEREALGPPHRDG
jgi:hypothetical protein